MEFLKYEIFELIKKIDFSSLKNKKVLVVLPTPNLFRNLNNFAQKYKIEAFHENDFVTFL